MLENLIAFIWIPIVLIGAFLGGWLIKRHHRNQAMQAVQRSEEREQPGARGDTEQMPLDLFSQGKPRRVFGVEPERFVTLYIDMPDGNQPALQDVRLYAVERNLDFYQQVFHRLSDTPGTGSLYIFASGQPPGILSEADDDFPIASLATFMPLPHITETPLKAFEQMLDDAFAFAHRFDAKLVDDQGVEITSPDSQIVRNCRELITEYAGRGETDAGETDAEREQQNAEPE